MKAPPLRPRIAVRVQSVAVIEIGLRPGRRSYRVPRVSSQTPNIVEQTVLITSEINALGERRKGIDEEIAGLVGQRDGIDEKIAGLTRRLHGLWAITSPSETVAQPVVTVHRSAATPPHETQRAKIIRLVAEHPGDHYRSLMPELGFADDDRHRNTLRALLCGLGQEGFIENAGRPGHWRPAAHNDGTAAAPVKSDVRAPTETARSIVEIVSRLGGHARGSAIVTAATKVGIRRATVYANLQRLCDDGLLVRTGTHGVYTFSLPAKAQTDNKEPTV